MDALSSGIQSGVESGLGISSLQLWGQIIGLIQEYLVVMQYNLLADVLAVRNFCKYHFTIDLFFQCQSHLSGWEKMNEAYRLLQLWQLWGVFVFSILCCVLSSQLTPFWKMLSLWTEPRNCTKRIFYCARVLQKMQLVLI